VGGRGQHRDLLVYELLEADLLRFQPVNTRRKGPKDINARRSGRGRVQRIGFRTAHCDGRLGNERAGGINYVSRQAAEVSLSAQSSAQEERHANERTDLESHKPSSTPETKAMQAYFP